MSRERVKARRACGASAPGSFRVELLESRRLLTTLLSLFDNVLTITEDASTGNTTTFKLIDNNTKIEIDEEPPDLNENQALFQDGWVVDNQTFGSATGPETGINRIVANTGDHTDSYDVLSMNIPLVVAPGAGSFPILDIGDPDLPTGAQAITAPVTFNAGGALNAQLNIHDEMDLANVDPTLTSDSVFGLAGAEIDFSGPGPNASGNPLMTVNCFTGANTSNYVLAQDPTNPAAVDYSVRTVSDGSTSVETINAGSQVEIISNTGVLERVREGSNGSTSGIQGTVTAQFQPGSAGSIAIDDSADPTSRTFSFQSAGEDQLLEDGRRLISWQDPISSISLQTGTAQNTVNFNYGARPQFPLGVTVSSNGTNDVVNIDELPTNMNVSLIGGAGVDSVSVDGFFVDGTVVISNPTGQDAVTVDTSTSNASQAITVSDTSVGGLSLAALVMSNLKSLTVIGGKAFDNFDVKPSPTTAFTIDGGPNSGPASDRMDVDTSKVTGAELTLQNAANGEQGAYTFSNRQPINFTRLGVITPTFDDLPGSVYNAQDDEPVAGVTVVVDVNGNGVADAGEPTTTTAADGTFSFSALPTGTLPLLIQSNAFSLAVPVSATLAAGVLQQPINVAVVPVAMAGAPDLVASVNTTVSKSATSKPKVTIKITNLGAAMSLATSAQVLLFASSDKSLDPQDAKLLTVNTPLLKLKAKASKILTLTGIAPSSLTTGHYFVLASVDAGNLIAESNEANNVGASAKQLLLAPPLADLTGKFGAVPKSASKSKALTIPVTLQNVGTIAAGGAIEVDFFASADKTLDDTDVEIGSGFPLSAHLGAGKSRSAKFKLSLVSIPAGSHYIIARINSTHVINEASFDNNVFSSAAPITIS